MDGAVKFNVSANTAQFDAAMRRVGSVAQTTGDRVRFAFSGLSGILAGGAIVAGLQGVLRKMDDISDRAKRFGVSAEEIQRVGNAADIVGTNFDAVARAINRTGVAANKAAREGGSVAEAFARVNLDPAAFAAASLEERIQMIGKAQQAANGDAQKMSDLFEVIGVKAANINFSELLGEMKQVNAASNETVETLAEANDRLERAGQAATVFGANLINGISKAAERFGSLLAGAGFKTIEELDQQIARDNASARLQQQGKLLLNEEGQPITAPRFAPNTKATREQIAKASENAKLIDAEVARAEAERKAAQNASRQIRTQDTEDAQGGRQDFGRMGAGGSSPESSQHQNRAYEEKLKELYYIYARSYKSITSLELDNSEEHKRLLTLRKQYEEAVSQVETQYRGGAAMSRGVQQMGAEASTTEAQRQQAQQQTAAPQQSAAEKIATETTLQKVASFLEQLNTKLPQPVLV